jgi:hypothetical protein
VVVKQRLKSFKTFESDINKVGNFLSEDDIKDIFIDLLDKEYTITFYDSKFGKYYFDLKLEDNSGFEYIEDNDNVWGCTDLNSMSRELTSLFEILDDAKQRLNSMGYLVGFEPEFSFSETSHFSVSCHIAHSSLD